ncbi:MAG: diguanylate cyclase [Anaerolineales bacterium]|nr:diguanylate cyclase [Anaerolineales bacterium]
MNKLIYPSDRTSPLRVTALAFILYTAILIVFHHEFGSATASFAVLPVISAGWFFGITGGAAVAILAIFASELLHVITNHSESISILNPENDVLILVLLSIAFIIGKLGTVTRERQSALLKLEEYEKSRQAYTNFLELLHTSTGLALEAKSIEATLKILVEQIGALFEADDCYFAFWDNQRDLPQPTIAYGSMSDIYPYMMFQPGERPLSKSVMEAQSPIAVSDTENSPFIDSKIAMLYPNRSMLGFPLIVDGQKLGTLTLGYKRSHTFDQEQISRASITAEQVGLVLAKSLLLEEERKQVRQLSALYDVAHISSQVDDEDALIERVTDIIGNNLFPDNFGILLLDEQTQILHPHSSYKVYSIEEVHTKPIKVGEGVTGRVALTRKSQCIGNVRQISYYLDVDDRTISELCVPILFQEQLLGVINAESTKRKAFNEEDERLLATLAGQLATAIKQIRRTQAERKWLNQLAHSNDIIYSIAQITAKIERALTKENIILLLGEELGNIGLTCIMASYDKERSQFTIDYTSLESHFLHAVENALGYPLVQYAFSEDKLEQVSSAKGIIYPVMIPNPEEEIQALFTGTKRDSTKKTLQEIGITPGTELLRLPLKVDEDLQGILWIWGSGIQNSDLPIMSIFAKQIGTSFERVRLFKEVQELALTDPLTGLSNRRNLFELGNIEFARATRMEREFCCMMLDLDHFKKINDNYGHLIGDQILKEFANRCKNSIREIDIIGRYGGEELIILLPETKVDTAKLVAERLRKNIANTPMIASGQEINITVSIGIAGKSANTSDLETLVARADQALYVAKHKGRNVVAVSV